MRLHQSEIEQKLNTKRLGRTLVLLNETDSTNNHAKRIAAEGAGEGTVVLAERQTAGKGRLGRSFFSPEDSGIYMSIVLRPNMELKQTMLLTSMAAVAAAHAIEKVSGVYAQIKWVNDIFLNKKKVCGILTEAGVTEGSISYVVLGIGVNVGRMEFPDELKNIATSVSNECGREISRNELIAELLNEVEALYDTMEDGSFLLESRSRSILLGKEVRVITPEGSCPAKAVEIDDMGQLIVETEEGRQTLNSGEVSVRFS